LQQQQASTGSSDLACHVGAGVNATLGEFPAHILSVTRLLEQDHGLDLRKSDLEALLNCLQHLLVCLRAYEGDGETLGSEATGTTNTVKVRVSVTGEIIVDRKIDTLDINTTTEDIGRNTDTLVELLELLITLDTIYSVSNRAATGGRWTLTAPPG
jgi:hypothetical protein